MTADRDLTKRVAALQGNLDRAEAMFDAAMQHAPSGMALVDLEGRLLAVNPALCRLLGRDQAALLTMTTLDVTHPDDADADLAYGRRAIQGEPADEPLDKRYVRPDGEVVWGRLTVVALKGPDGKPQRLVGQVVDITEQKEAELELQHGHALQRIAGSIARIGGWSIDLDDDVARWSPELRTMLAFPQDRELVRHEVLSRHSPADQERILAALDACRREGTPFDLEADIVNFDGRVMTVRIVGERDLDRRRIVGAMQDVTESKLAAAVTRRLTEQLATTLEAISDAVFTIDRSWQFTYLNRRAEVLFDTHRHRLIGTDVWTALPSIVGSEVERAYRTAMTENVATHVDAYFCEPRSTWVEEHIFPSDQGLTVFLADVGDRVRRDIAQQRLIDAERDAADRLRELDRMKNAFLSAVSHELRTPLSIVEGAAGTLQRLRGKLNDDARAELEDALVDQSGRLAKLLGDLLDIDRLTRAAPGASRQRIDIADVTRSAVATMPETSRVRVDAPSKLIALGDHVQIERIVVNLVGNALKYAPDGEILVKLRKFAGDRILLEVHDQGPGIPQAELARVFEPFHRVDEDHPQPGTGIGLALVAEFARMQGGRAWAEGGDRGAHLFVDLPAASRSSVFARSKIKRSTTARS
ncbi:MAG: PAS domain S-box protein [Nitriliruptoraceae bacterium]